MMHDFEPDQGRCLSCSTTGNSCVCGKVFKVLPMLSALQQSSLGHFERHQNPYIYVPRAVYWCTTAMWLCCWTFGLFCSCAMAVTT